ncbi:hypothetical protein AB8849_07390 [Proteus vulgaris]
MEEFKWRPETAYQVGNEPKVKVVKFGNGTNNALKMGSTTN